MENLMHQLQEYFYNQFPIIEQNNLIVIITALVIALLYVFFGYKLLRVYISLLGFLIGFALGIVICAVFDLSNTTAVIVIICVCAVALAALGFWLYKAGLFVMILLSLFPIILSIVSEFTTIQPVFMWIGSILFALVLAILAIFFVRPVVIIRRNIQNGLENDCRSDHRGCDCRAGNLFPVRDDKTGGKIDGIEWISRTGLHETIL